MNFNSWGTPGRHKKHHPNRIPHLPQQLRGSRATCGPTICCHLMLLQQSLTIWRRTLTRCGNRMRLQDNLTKHRRDQDRKKSRLNSKASLCKRSRNSNGGEPQKIRLCSKLLFRLKNLMSQSLLMMRMMKNLAKTPSRQAARDSSILRRQHNH